MRAAERGLATPEVLRAIASALSSALALGTWSNALAAGESSETLLARMGSGPLSRGGRVYCNQTPTGAISQGGARFH